MSELQTVVLTGFGAITTRGDETLAGPTNARTAPGPLGSIEGFDLGSYLASPKTYLDRASALALAGCALALKDAGIETPVAQNDFGITLGTHFGCVETMKTFWDKAQEKGVRLANPLLFSHSYFNSPISLCAIEFGLKGYHGTFCAQEHSGTEAVRAAFDAIRLGHANAMLCGGADGASPTRQLVVPSEQNTEAAVFFALESSAHAQARNAQHAVPVEEGWFDGLDLDAAKNQYGDCGGALGTLALLTALNIER